MHRQRRLARRWLVQSPRSAGNGRPLRGMEGGNGRAPRPRIHAWVACPFGGGGELLAGQQRGDVALHGLGAAEGPPATGRIPEVAWRQGAPHGRQPRTEQRAESGLPHPPPGLCRYALVCRSSRFPAGRVGASVGLPQRRSRGVYRKTRAKRRLIRPRGREALHRHGVELLRPRRRPLHRRPLHRGARGGAGLGRRLALRLRPRSGLGEHRPRTVLGPGLLRPRQRPRGAGRGPRRGAPLPTRRHADAGTSPQPRDRRGRPRARRTGAGRRGRVPGPARTRLRRLEGARLDLPLAS